MSNPVPRTPLAGGAGGSGGGGAGLAGQTSPSAHDLIAQLVAQLQGASIAGNLNGQGPSGNVKAKVPTFSGKKKDWPLYKMQMQAYLATLNLEGVLEEAFEQQLPATQATVLDTNVPAEKSQEDAREANNKVMQVLVLGFKKPSLVNALTMSKTTEWPVGKAWKVWKEFHERFAPDDATSEMTMEDELVKLKIKKSEDPKAMADKIAAIAVKYGSIVDEADKYKTIIRACRKHYAQAISTYEQTYQLVYQTKPSSSELLGSLHKVFLLQEGNKASNGDDTDDDAEPADVALANAGTSGKPFKKNCFHCGEKGHMAKDCPNKNGGGGEGKSNNSNGNKGKGKFKGDCNFCGKAGHMARDCFSNPESKNYKGDKEKETAAGNVEVLVPSFELEESLEGVDLLLSSIENEAHEMQGEIQSMGESCGTE